MNVEEIEKKYNVRICEECGLVTREPHGFVAYKLNDDVECDFDEIVCRGMTIDRIVTNLRRNAKQSKL